MRCHRCDCDITLVAMKPEKQSVCFTINYQDDFMQAKTIGGILENLDELYKCASGEPMKVLLQGFEISAKTIKIWLLVAPEIVE